MPTIPQSVTLTNSSVEILNVIRNNATQNYKDYVPKATPDAGSIREIGAIIMDYPSLQNEFLSALVNRIGMVLVTSKSYDNPWSMFKRGMLEFGETIEEIFVNIAKPFQYDPAVAESKVFAREMPDVKAAFHIMNYQKFYKHTIQQEQLRHAFLSWSGITDLISKIVEAMYTGANYDEFQTMKYMLAKHIINGQMNTVSIPEISATNMKPIVSTIKGVSNEFEFLSADNNLAGVMTKTAKSDQYLIINTKFDAIMDVEVLASAFNMNKAEFSGRRVLVDSFGKLDNARLDMLFANDPTYTRIDEEMLAELDKIPCVLVDKDWFMIFDNFNKFTEQYNGEGLYWNYWYHVWKTFSVSPFANSAVFVAGDVDVDGVTLNTEAITLGKGQSAQLTATVVTTGFASKAVTWSSNSDDVIVTNSGYVTVKADATATTATITASSVVDDEVHNTCTVTIV